MKLIFLNKFTVLFRKDRPQSSTCMQGLGFSSPFYIYFLFKSGVNFTSSVHGLSIRRVYILINSFTRVLASACLITFMSFVLHDHLASLPLS